MKKDEFIKSLQQIENDIKRLSKIITNHNQSQIRHQPTKDQVLKLARDWFENIERQLTFYNVRPETIAKYHQLFDTLLQMGFKDASKARYISIMEQLRSSFNEDLTVGVIKFTGDISNFAQLDEILASLTEIEKPLMKEAIDCAKNGYLRASAVLGWAATVNRLHKTVEKMGFNTFNQKSREMNDIDEGRYKRFKKTFHVVNMAELQATVFDNDLLWVLEYCEFIDNNQHDRLSMCFVMRNNSAHPGESLIKEENITSFYSDLKTIIFDNPKFRLSENSADPII